MPFIGNAPARVPLTSADITDGIISSADIASGAITAAKLASGVGGKVLQVVSATDSTARTTTSTSFVTSSNTLSVTLTPSSTSNKIFIIATGSLYIAGGAVYARATIYRNGSTNLGNGSSGMTNTYDGSNDNSSGLSLSYLDSPNTTSSTTYQVYFHTESSGTTAYLNVNNAQGSITAFEIAG